MMAKLEFQENMWLKADLTYILKQVGFLIFF